MPAELKYTVSGVALLERQHLRTVVVAHFLYREDAERIAAQLNAADALDRLADTLGGVTLQAVRP